MSPSKLAVEYSLSTKSITRSINEIKKFLAGSNELTGNTRLVYSHASKAYRLFSDDYLSDSELYSTVKLLIESHAFSAQDILRIIEKLKRFTAIDDREKAERIIRKEISACNEVEYDRDNVMENLWRIIIAITEKKEITINYYKENQTLSQKRLQPLSLDFSEGFFCLGALDAGHTNELVHYRVDRIIKIVEHRKRFDV